MSRVAAETSFGKTELGLGHRFTTSSLQGEPENISRRRAQTRGRNRSRSRARRKERSRIRGMIRGRSRSRGMNRGQSMKRGRNRAGGEVTIGAINSVSAQQHGHSFTPALAPSYLLLLIPVGYFSIL